MVSRLLRKNPYASWQDLVRAGYARAISPTTDTGWATYGTGRLFLPAATNVIPDPQGTLADGTFWPASTANTTVTANQPLPIPLPALPAVTKCIKFVNDGTADTPATATVTVTASKDYYTSFYLFAPTLGGHLHISAENGHTWAIASLESAVTGWTRYSVKSPTVAGETTLHLHFAFEGGSAATVYVTAAQCAQESVLTPYFDGTYPSCVWTGTAHASTSTRTASNLRYSLPSGVFGTTVQTLAARVSPLWSGPSGQTAYPHIVQTRNGNSYALSLWSYATAGFSSASHDGSTATLNNGVNTAYTAGSSHAMIARLAAATLDFRLDGVDAAQKALAATPLAPTEMRLGGQTTTPSAGCYVGPALTSPTRATDTDTATLSSMLTAGATGMDLFRFFRTNGYVNTLVLPLENDSTGWLVL